MVGINDDGTRMEPNYLKKRWNLVRPNDFDEPDTFYQYLNN